MCEWHSQRNRDEYIKMFVHYLYECLFCKKFIQSSPLIMTFGKHSLTWIWPYMNCLLGKLNERGKRGLCVRKIFPNCLWDENWKEKKKKRKTPWMRKIIFSTNRHSLYWVFCFVAFMKKFLIASSLFYWSIYNYDIPIILWRFCSYLKPTL